VSYETFYIVGLLNYVKMSDENQLLCGLSVSRVPHAVGLSIRSFGSDCHNSVITKHKKKWPFLTRDMIYLFSTSKKTIK
jgi:hypothetical protein